MKVFSNLIVIGMFFSVLTGCSMKHYIAGDYPVYLAKNEGTEKLEKTTVNADYLLTPNTVEHRYQFRSATVGYAHVWIVEFGKMLESSLQSKDMQGSFGRITRSEGKEATGNLVVFDLKQYEFKDYGAHVVLAVSVTNNGKKVFDATYESDGKKQGAKMFWGGVFAMKNSIQQSTKIAIDDILGQFIRDVNKSSTLRT